LNGLEGKTDMKKNIFFICIGIVALFLLIPYFAGYFSRNKIKPGLIEQEKIVDFHPISTARVETRSIIETYEAVGTVRPRTEFNIEAQVTGKILEISVKPGDFVKKGSRLLKLEDNEYRTRLERATQGLRSTEAMREQAKQMIQAAQARYTQAESNYRRIRQLFDDEVLSTREAEQAEAEFLQAEAELKQAKDGLTGAEAGVSQALKTVEEAKIALDYTDITAPEDAEIAKRLVEPGDLALPGKPLLVVQAAGAMRLEAFVREGLISNVQPGKELSVSIEALNKSVTGVVEEVIPSADPTTRTFLVKVGLPNIIGLYPGMFGRLLVPSGTRQAILVPPESISRVGQLETIIVREDKTWRKYFIKSGKKIEDRIEVLSGLKGNETIALLGSDNG
jgi:RND family efflux transporter MFP subunit